MIRLIGIAAILAGFLWLGYHTYTWYESRKEEPGGKTVQVDRIGREGNRRENDVAKVVVQRLANGQSGVVDESAIHREGIGAVYYSPWQNLEAIEYNAILGSRCRHLDVAAYSLTDWKVAEALVKFAQSGRPVRIYRDREQYEDEQKRSTHVSDMLRIPGISIRVKGTSVLMHQKSWSDGCVLREGSANMSPSGLKQQDNTLTFLKDGPSINNFEAAFDAMWKRPDNIVVQ